MTGTRAKPLLQNDWSVGIHRSDHIDPRGAWDLVNYLLDADGVPYKRGGTQNHSNAAFGTGLRFLWDGYLAPGRRTVFANVSDFGVLGADDATPLNLGGPGLSTPKPVAELGGYLFLPGGYIYGGSRKTATYSTGTVALTNDSATVTGTGTAFTANVDAGMLLQRADERVYVVKSVDSDTQLTLEETYVGVTGSGLSYTLSPLYEIRGADPYEDSDCYSVASNRLISCTGNLVRFSGINDPHAFGVDDEHELPDGVSIVAEAAIGSALLVFTTAGVWAIHGLALDIIDAAGNSNHRVELVNRDLVAVSPSAIGTYRNGLVVPTTSGVWLMDAVSAPELLTRSINPLYDKHIDDGYHFGGAMVHLGHYFLPVLNSGNTTVDHLVCRLNRPVKIVEGLAFPWARLANAGGNLAALAQRVEGDTRILLGALNAAAARVVDCDGFFQPVADVKNDADGTAPQFTVVTRDVETGNQIDNLVSDLRARYELVDAGTDNPALTAEYSIAGMQSSGAEFDVARFDVDVFADAEAEGWTALSGTAAESNGLTPKRWPVRKKANRMRFRLRCSTAAASARLRELEVFVRPSRRTL